jgi:hypothetical protein
LLHLPDPSTQPLLDQVGSLMKVTRINVRTNRDAVQREADLDVSRALPRWILRQAQHEMRGRHGPGRRRQHTLNLVHGVCLVVVPDVTAGCDLDGCGQFDGHRRCFFPA